MADEIKRIRDKKQSLLVQNAECEGLKMPIQDMHEFLEQQTTRIEEYDEQWVVRLFEKITIYENKFVFDFKLATRLNLKK